MIEIDDDEDQWPPNIGTAQRQNYITRSRSGFEIRSSVGVVLVDKIGSFNAARDGLKSMERKR